MTFASMPCAYPLNQNKDDQKSQLSDIGIAFHTIIGHISGQISGLDTSAYHQPLLALLVGIGLILHSFRLFLLISQAKIEALLLLLASEKVPAANTCDMSVEHDTEEIRPASDVSDTLPVSNAVIPTAVIPACDIAVQRNAEGIRPASDVSDTLSASNAVIPTAVIPACDIAVQRNAEESRPASDVSDTLPVSNAVSLTVAFSRQDIILKRLAELSEEQHISPIIFEAAARQDYMTCSRLIEEGVDCDIPGPSGRSLAHVAAMTGDKRLLHTLSATKCSQLIWSTCSQGKIPLDYAALNNHLEIVRYLIEKVTFPSLEYDEKVAILEHSTEFAQSRGHIVVANYLLAINQGIRRTEKERLFRYAVSINDIKSVKRSLKEGIHEPSALWDACEGGFISLVSILLSSTHDGFSYDITLAINFVSTTGQQDLLVLLLCGINNVSKRKFEAAGAYRHALGAGQMKICEFLVSSEEVDVQYAFKVAGDYGNMYLLRWMIGKEGKDKFHGAPINRAFHATVSTCFSLPVVRFLVENGADVDSEHEIWGTVLQCAAANNSFDLVNYLVSDRLADINAPGRLGGSSPMMAAVSAGNLSMFHYFLNLQTCLNNQHGKFGNILQTASYLGRREILEEILARGFDINARLEPYGSALILAIQGRNLDIAELLISRGADVNVNIPLHGTALHLAAADGSESIVKSLIRAGANVNAEGGDFSTPIQAAASKNHQLIVLHLLDCGAKVNTQGGRYGNALRAAEKGGHKLLAKLLLFSGAKVI